MHVSYLEEDTEAYTLFLSDSEKGKMVEQKDGNVTLEYALELENWNIITMQQSSSQSYNASKYKNLDKLIEYVRGYQPTAKLYWHMTWAYDTDQLISSESSFASSVAMYNGIVEAVSEVIIPSGEFSLVIPVGTAIQNLRTSSLGDDQTRDGHHLSYGIGRYTAALTWFRFICDVGVENITWTPSSYPEIETNIAIIKEAVENAYKSPFTLTESSYK